MQYGNAIFHRLQLLIKFINFCALICSGLYTSNVFPLLLRENRALRWIASLFVSKFFQTYDSARKFISLNSHCTMKGLIFTILWKQISAPWRFRATVTASWKHFSSMLYGFIVAFLWFIDLKLVLVHLKCKLLT